MTVPTYDQFIEPLLRYLAANENGVTAKQAHEQVANALGLSEEDKQTMLPSGAQLIYKNRTGWAHDQQRRVGASAVGQAAETLSGHIQWMAQFQPGLGTINCRGSVDSALVKLRQCR